MEDIATADEVLRLLAERGGGTYFGEPVTVLEHCLQTAWFARQAASPDTLIVAALLHDVGHLLHGGGEDVADHGLDTRHEELAEAMLAAHLPRAVTEPIRLHVAAKRYLCFADAGYFDALSPSSRLSLGLQGGLMAEAEAEEFLAQPFAPEAVALRRWDDEAKVADLAVPQLEAYRALVEGLWRSFQSLPRRGFSGIAGV